ncbi:hypothetical protein ACHAXS_005695 [Conticribra weissflogii]
MESDPTKHRRNSVFAAASALASLGTDTPPMDGAEKQGVGAVTSPTIVQSAGDNAASDAKKSPSMLDNDVPMTFPQKLMEVLANREISDIITWLPHGKGFIILQKRKFAAEVMPLYFKHSKFTSFTRKLNRWGFTRITRGPETGAYYHKFFQRDNHLLCMQMHCQSNKLTSTNSPRAAQQAGAMDSPCVTSAMTSLRIDETAPPLPLISHESRGNFAFRAPTGPSSLLRPNNDMSRMHDMAQGNCPPNRSMMEMAFFRQQQLLQEEQKLRMMANRQQQEFRAMQAQQQLQQRIPSEQFQPQLRSNTGNQPSRYANYLGLNTSSSRQHPLVIQAALDALKGCNDRAYLTMLMTKEHEQAKSEAITGNMGFIPQAQIQQRVHAAMQAQMRQLELYNRQQSSGRNNSPIQPVSQSNANTTAAALKISTPLVTQSQLAQLRREINNPNASNSQTCSSSGARRPRGVRRASAA